MKDYAQEKLPITVLLAAKNEAVNLPYCLSALGPATRVVVLDSHSTDATAEIVRAHSAEVIQFDYHGGYPKKRQWGLDNLLITTEWILLLDADEMVPDALWEEIGFIISHTNVADAFFIKKGFHFMGRRFKFGGFSHSAVLLFRRGKARFEHIIDDPNGALDMEIHERLIVNGKVGQLKVPLHHEDFKGLEAYIERHNKYSSWEARVRYQFLQTGKWGKDSIEAKLIGDAQEVRRFLKSIIIRVPFESFLWFAYHYFFRLGFLEGRAGLIASQIRASYISQVRAKMYELRKTQG